MPKRARRAEQPTIVEHGIGWQNTLGIATTAGWVTRSFRATNHRDEKAALRRQGGDGACGGPRKGLGACQEPVLGFKSGRSVSRTALAWKTESLVTFAFAANVPDVVIAQTFQVVDTPTRFQKNAMPPSVIAEPSSRVPSIRSPSNPSGDLPGFFALVNPDHSIR